MRGGEGGGADYVSSTHIINNKKTIIKIEHSQLDSTHTSHKNNNNNNNNHTKIAISDVVVSQVVVVVCIN